MTADLSLFELWQIKTYGNVLRNGALIPAEKIPGMAEHVPTYPAARADQGEPEDRPTDQEIAEIFNRENPEVFNDY